MADKKKKRAPESDEAKKAAAEPAPPPLSFMMKTRGWVDALVIAYVLAMFIRSYAVELFKIPTGSMTPTLVGDDAAVQYDYNKDGLDDLILFFRGHLLQVFTQTKSGYEGQIWLDGANASWIREIAAKARPRKDMILVNKFYYWFRPPKRGDIIVFKVPNRPEMDSNPDPDHRNPWNPKTPIFIKRCVGIPGDKIHIDPARLQAADPSEAGHVGAFGGRELHILGAPAKVNGATLNSPEVFKRVFHFPFGFGPWRLHVEAQDFEVPAGQIFMMGDNSANSKDSRAWGGVPLENIKGKAIFRYWPFTQMSFLK